MGVSSDASIARGAAQTVDDAFLALGLPTHGVEFSLGGDTLGWTFSEQYAEVSLNPRRCWRYRLGVEEFLRKNWASGEELSIIVGHLAFASLLRRELLSCFSAVYAFIRFVNKPQMLWDSVRRELQWALALLPLARRDLAAQCWHQVHASDASPWGRGILVGERDPFAVQACGRICERWRFGKTDEHHRSARAHAFFHSPDMLSP